MKIYKKLKEVMKDVKDGMLELDCDVKFDFDLKADFSLKIGWNILASGDIDVFDISARNISARNISAGNISAGNISARDISAWNISAGNISAENISAERNISARNILYYAVCFAYNDISCLSIKGKRKNSKHFCLDGKIDFKKQEGR